MQDPYLAGRRDEAMLALPDDLIDLMSIVGPPDRAKAKISDFKGAGVDTLIVAGMASDTPSRIEQLAPCCGAGSRDRRSSPGMPFHYRQPNEIERIPASRCIKQFDAL